MRVRTEYSFRHAVGKINEVAERLNEIDYEVYPISDTASTFGYVKWEKLAKKAGKRPIFGIEIAVSPSVEAKKPIVSNWTFFAIDDLRALNLLYTQASRQFRYTPLLSYDQAMAAQDLIKIAGHESQLEFMSPQSNLFIALAPSLSRGLARQAAKSGYSFIASSDNKYTRAEDKGLYEIILGRNANVQTYKQYLLNDDEWRSSVKNITDDSIIEQSIGNRSWAIDQCQATLQKASLPKTQKNMTLKELCIIGAEKLKVDLTDAVYYDRMMRELELIELKKFEDYFLIVADIMQFARTRMACGPARGSSCGSLVCYLLEITTVDPLKFGLLFERFISSDRTDLPDIDIDLSDQYRHLVFEYCQQKYGADCVAKLGAVAMYKPKSAIGESAAALHVPTWRTDAVLENMIIRSSGDARAQYTMLDTFNETDAGRKFITDFPEMKISARMEGHARHYTTHAAGVVITDKPLSNYVTIDERTGSAFCDKKDGERFDLLKIDALGLTQLSVFEDALELAGLDRFHLETIPLDDKAAFEVLNKHQFSGIFQFNGLALQNIVKQMKEISELNDIVAIGAVGRPGPMTTGGASTWTRRRNGDEVVTYHHPMVEPFLRETFGVLLYQEQILKICKEIGGFSWEDANQVRLTMSKRLGVESLSVFGNAFMKSCVEKGMPKEISEKLWENVGAFGAWSFNQSHAVAYGLISYRCCWLKAHYPHEFAAATLTHETVPMKQIQMLREMNREGIDYIPVDKDKSTDRWVVATRAGRKVLVGPVHNVKGIGPKLMSTIMSCRARGEPLPDRAIKLLTNPVTDIDSLWPVRDAFFRSMPDPTTRNIYTKPTQIIDLKIQEYKQEVVVFCVIRSINLRDENEDVHVAKRGGLIYTDGMTQSLNLQLRDDTDIIFGKINRYDYARIGKAIVEVGGPEKHLYVMKGFLPGSLGGWGNFRKINIKAVRYIGPVNGRMEIDGMAIAAE